VSASFNIITVTLNPAIDETVFLKHLRPGAVNRATSHHRQPGGTGVNVSAMLGGYGIATTATGFLGRENARLFEGLFAKGMIRDEFLRIDGETRVGIKIVEQSTRETTDLNFAGADPTAEELNELLEKLHDFSSPGTWFVIAGSLPAGVSLDFFGRVLEQLKLDGAKIAVDTSGEALKAAIECGVDIIKPNCHELEEILGCALPDRASQVAAALKLQRAKVPHVILSLGSEGALFVSPDGALLADPPPVAVVSTVGAGDSLLAGYLAGLVTGRGAEERARLATVFAWCALEHVSRSAPTAGMAQERMSRIGVHPLSVGASLARADHPVESSEKNPR
jgi:1-phosphofructokinase